MAISSRVERLTDGGETARGIADVNAALRRRVLTGMSPHG